MLLYTLSRRVASNIVDLSGKEPTSWHGNHGSRNQACLTLKKYVRMLQQSTNRHGPLFAVLRDVVISYITQ